MSSKSISCIATSRWQADNIVTRLKELGFADGAISVLFAEKKDSAEFARARHTKLPDTKGAEGTATGAGTGGVIGGALGLLAGIGTLVIPGVGPFIAVGPVMATLGGGVVGATAGGIVGGLIGLGIPEVDARCYENKLKEGGILIVVHGDDREQIERAWGVFEQFAASHITGSCEMAAAEKNQAQGVGVPYQSYTGREPRTEVPSPLPML